MSTATKEPPTDGVLSAADLPSPEERWATGKACRKQTSRAAHAQWRPPANRSDPVLLLQQSSKGRITDLVPIRYGRMLVSPFAFLRGSSIVMAHDLAATPVTGMQVQLCGDAHLANFGVYASPERNLLFDLNDFDETLPGPWEYDIKRLATSFVVAGRSRNMRNPAAGKPLSRVPFPIAGTCESTAGWACSMSGIRGWTPRLPSRCSGVPTARSGRSIWRKHGRRNRLQALSKLVAIHKGQMRIVDNPPLVHHVGDATLRKALPRLIDGYCQSLQEDRRGLVERYRFVDFALKVVGVGSVGTHCYIVLLDSSHREDPLFLQIKEAQASVLEPATDRADTGNHGFRVVSGQRQMQSASDIFLGWTCDGGRDYYVRQLRDMKGAADLEAMDATDLPTTPACAGGCWPGLTPAPVIRPLWRATSARATSSTRPSPPSPTPTPTRPSATLTPSKQL